MEDHIALNSFKLQNMKYMINRKYIKTKGCLQISILRYGCKQASTVSNINKNCNFQKSLHESNVKVLTFLLRVLQLRACCHG